MECPNDSRPHRLPISACIVSAAEAHRIRPALKSISGWTSEIIVVLNEEVVDGTDRVAEEFGAKVYREPWKGHIGQKNSASQKASQPWLLCLDADEEVSPNLQSEISAVVGKDDPAYSAYEFPRCTFFCGRWIRHGDWYPDRVCRLWRRHAARWGGEDPHSRLVVQGKIGRLGGDLLHRTGENYSQMCRKALDYAHVFAQEQQRTGRRVTAVDLLFRPFWRFFRCYVVRQGFLDGWAGMSVAWMGSFYTFLRYAEAMEAQRVRNNKS